METNKTILIAVLTLIIGLGLGYSFSNNRMERNFENRIVSGTHVMPNGEMMGNGSSMDMDDMMESMNAALKGKTGDAFDAAFLSEMIVHHQGAVAMAELALTNANHQEIKDLAADIIGAQNKEIAQMKVWQKFWFNKER